MLISGLLVCMHVGSYSLGVIALKCAIHLALGAVMVYEVSEGPPFWKTRVFPPQKEGLHSILWFGHRKIKLYCAPSKHPIQEQTRTCSKLSLWESLSAVAPPNTLFLFVRGGVLCFQPGATMCWVLSTSPSVPRGLALFGLHWPGGLRGQVVKFPREPHGVTALKALCRRGKHRRACRPLQALNT